MKELKDAIRSFDNFGESLNFNFGRQPKLKSFRGGLNRLLIYIITLFIGYKVVFQKWLKGPKEELLSYSYSWAAPKVNLYEEFIYPMLLFAWSNPFEGGFDSNIEAELVQRYVRAFGVGLAVTDI